MCIFKALTLKHDSNKHSNHSTIMASRFQKTVPLLVLSMFVIYVLTSLSLREKVKNKATKTGNPLQQGLETKQPELTPTTQDSLEPKLIDHIGVKVQDDNGVGERPDPKPKGYYVSRQHLLTFDPMTLETPLPFLPNYRNPCFTDEYSKIYCLPYFFILSSQKCGTSDLYRTLVVHQNISANKKEFHWWNRARFVPYPKHPKINMSEYMDWYNSSTQMIEKVVVQHQGNSYHPLVVGDGTASSLYDQLEWRKMPQNRGLSHPTVISAHVIRHVLPDAKFIVILRNPTDRLYSDYTYYSSLNYIVPDSRKFDKKVKEGISWFQDCLANKVQKNGSCLYDVPEYVKTSDPSWHPDLSWDPVVRLRAGLYSEFLRDWFNVFPREQFYIVTLEEFSKRKATQLKQMYKFLELEQISKSLELTKVLSQKRRTTKSSYKVPFLKETRQLLDTFYKPYNVKLSKMLDSHKFLWDDA